MAGFEKGKVTANGIEFHYIEKGEGPLMLLLHGFPDHASSFAPQLESFAEAGYRAVAPYMRGYAPTGPSPDEKYFGVHLGLDVVALIEALGYDDAVVLGHDWGAAAAYGAAVLAPERVSKLIASAGQSAIFNAVLEARERAGLLRTFRVVIDHWHHCC